MGVDSRIALSGQPLQLRDPLEQYGNALAVQGAQQRNALTAQTMQQAQEDRALAAAQRTSRNALLARGLTGEELESELLRQGDVDYALKLGKDRRENLKTDAERKKAEAETANKNLDRLIKQGEQFAQGMRTATPETWGQFRESQAMMFGPDAAARIPPQFDPVWVQTGLQRTVTEVERLRAERERMTAAETARHNRATEATAAGQLRVSQTREARERDAPQGQVVTREDGTVVLVDRRNATGREVVGADGQPLKGQGKPPTEGQANANIYGSRMQNSHAIMNDLWDTGVKTPSLIKRGAESVPIVGGALGMGANAMFASGGEQQLEQAQRDFINATLRRESGAVISDAEFSNANKQYFPQPGDTDAVVQQKRRNREIAIAGMRTAAGPAWGKGMEGVSTPAPTVGAPKTPRAPPPSSSGGWSIREL